MEFDIGWAGRKFTCFLSFEDSYENVHMYYSDTMWSFRFNDHRSFRIKIL